MNQNEHIIVEEHNKRAVYELYALPTHGKLLLNGAEMKVGQRFTQGDIRNGILEYKHTKDEGNVAAVIDKFYYRVPLNSKEYLLPSTPRSACLPDTVIPKDGIFEFAILITCLPSPTEIRNREVTIMEDATWILSRNDLFYSSDNNNIKRYFQQPSVVVKESENEIFMDWKRFSGNAAFENGGVRAPPGSDAKRWEFQKDNSFRITNNSSNYTGMVNLTQSQSFKLKATVSSDLADDDLISVVIAYTEENGVPTTISVGRSGGGVFNGGTWFLFKTQGNIMTMISDKSSSAPNQFGNTQRQGWNKLGKTTIEVKRVGNAIEARCSQFSFYDENAKIPNAVLPIDDSTLITYSLPAPFNVPCQYGFGAFSQQNATFEDTAWAEIPYPPVVPPVPDPSLDPRWERFPVTYTVNFKTSETKAKFMLNNQPLKPGDQFTHKDLDEGRLKVVGTFKGAGTEYFSFNACVKPNRCTSGKFTVKVVEWPYPETQANEKTIKECAKTVTVTPDDLMFTTKFGSTPSQITATIDIAATQAINNDNNKVSFNKYEFTMQDIIDGNVQVTHNCGEDPTAWTETFIMNVCTNHTKCSRKTFTIEIIPIPVEKPPLEPTVAVSPQGCTYKLNFFGEWAPVGQCGVWSSVSGRVIPPPTQEAEILYVPDAQPAPVTLLALKNPAGQLEWWNSPVQFSKPPTPADGCPIQEVAPNTDKTKSLIEMSLWGDYGSGPPAFMLKSGGRNLLGTDAFVTQLKEPGQRGEQFFALQIPTAQIGSGPIELVYTQNEPKGSPTDRNLDVNWIKVNGKKTTFNTKLYTTGQKVTINGPYDSAPYLTSPYSCFTDLTGVKWIASSGGEWVPVTTGTGGNTDYTPVIKSVDDYMVEFADLGAVPGLNLKPVYVKPLNTVFTKVTDEYTPVPQPFTETFSVDDFQWIGANEFWLPYGASFDIYLFSNRFYVRYDILPDGGHTLIHASDPLVTSGSAGILANKSSTYNNSQITTRIKNAVGTWSNFPIAQPVLPITTMWDGVAASPTFAPYDLDPHHMGEYLVKIAGTESYAGFIATQRPRLVEKTYTGPRMVDPSKQFKPITQGTYSAWEYENPLEVFSYSGFNDFARQQQANFYLKDKGFANAYGGSAYGIYSPWLHFEAWKLYNNTNYVPAKQPLGWCNGRLSFLNYSSIRDNKEARNGGPVQSAPPSTDTTYTFRIRAFDIATGQQKIRTYKIHWTKTGKSAKGQTKATTDATVGTPSGFLPPKPKSAVCYYDDKGVIGNCKII